MAGLACALLPWYLPTAMIAKKVKDRLQQDFGREVSIGQMQVSWNQGVEIRDLEIRRHPQYGPGALLRIERLKTDFSPLKLLRSDIKEISVKGAHFFVVFDEKGVNISDLPPLEVADIYISPAVLHLVSLVENPNNTTSARTQVPPEGKEIAIFDIKAAQIHKDLELGGVSWVVEGRQRNDPNDKDRIGSVEESAAEPTFTSRGRIGEFTPENRIDPKDRYAQLSINDLDLSGLTLKSWYNRWRNTLSDAHKKSLPKLQQVRGRCSSQIDLTADQNDLLKLTGWFKLDGLELTDLDGKKNNRLWAKIDPVRVVLEGQYDQSAHTAHLDQLWVKAPGAEFTLTGEHHFQPKGADVNYLSLKEGSIDPASLLAALPGPAENKFLREIANAGEGKIEFEGELTSPGPRINCHLSINGTDWGYNSEELRKPFGQEFRLELSGQVDAGRQTIDNLLLQARLEEAALTVGPGYGKWTVPSVPAPPGETALPPWDVTGRWAALPIEKLQCAWQIEGAAEWLNAWPGLQARLQTRNAYLDGACQGNLSCEREEEKTLRCAGEIDLSPLDISIKHQQNKNAAPTELQGPQKALLTKPGGAAGSLAFEVEENLKNRRIAYHGYLNLAAGEIAARATGQARRQPTATGEWGPVQQEKWNFDLSSEKLQEAVACMPGVVDQKGRIIVADYRIDKVKGPAALKATLLSSEAGRSVSFDLQADDMGLALYKTKKTSQNPLVETCYWDKPPGSPCRLTGEIDITRRYDLINSLLSLLSNTMDPPLILNIKNLHLALGNSNAEITGHMLFDDDQVKSVRDWLSVCWAFDISGKGQINLNGPGKSDCPLLAGIAQKHNLGGRTNLQGKVTWNSVQDVLLCEGLVDLTRTQFTLEGGLLGPIAPAVLTVKPIGDELSLNFALGGNKDERKIQIDQLQVKLGDNIITAQGCIEEVDFERLIRATLPPPAAARLTVAAHAPQIGQISEWLPPARDVKLNGRLDARTDLLLQWSPQPSVQCQSFEIDGILRGVLAQSPVEIQLNQLTFSPPRIIMPAATIKIGDNQLTIIAEMETPDYASLEKQMLERIFAGQKKPYIHPRSEGRIDIVGANFDLDELRAWQKRLTKDWKGLSLSSEKKEGLNPTAEVTGILRQALPLVSRVRWTGSTDLGQLSFTDLKTNARYELQEFRSAYEIDQGRLRTRFWAGLYGGVVEGAVECDLNESSPRISYRQTAQDVKASPKLCPLVESEFPGMEVTGAISEQKQLQKGLFDLLDIDSFWTGTGTTVCREGVIYGPGGPDWMLRVFPGLKLVEYDWRETTNEFVMLEDGSKKNNMLFKGQGYDIYIEGVTAPVRDPNEYEQVIDLLQQDLLQSREQISALNAGKLNVSQAKGRWLRRQARGLEQLWQRRLAGEKLSIAQADYIVGGIIGMRKKELFEKPAQILRIPIFKSHSYIAGQFMFGVKTTHVPLIGR
ncbi:MAG: hypothetical protein AMJ79_07045 [Phycisphaerae bacterium SM23_30]|nr:MAG: hypothetical protein AMJ79_07045 [Phycisphaerae bacterium SM23_30]